MSDVRAASVKPLAACEDVVCSALLAERGPEGWWTGRLSTSALSTATAVMALEMVRRDQATKTRPAAQSQESPSNREGSPALAPLIAGGLRWLAKHQNDDGGWGDTTKSLSNISTTMLAHASFHAGDKDKRYEAVIARAASYIDRAGGIPAVVERYGKDRTFSIPILTHCALAGLVDWKDVASLPFELSCLPARFYKTVRLPVVSYALPALIAIGQVRHHHRRPRNPLTRGLRRLAMRPSLKVLERIQPSNGGFLEAAPLTSFVTMSLAGMGLSQHPVARRGLSFLIDSVRDDGSWPIDTNLATWLTTLSVNVLRGELPDEDRTAVRDWLLNQQYRKVHPYTNAAPGGWAWTDLPGGVPDADDTSGAILAVLTLRTEDEPLPERERKALLAAVGWLLDLQNRNGGWPTFCRGWGALPFDRSAADITAHALRAIALWRLRAAGNPQTEQLARRIDKATRKGFAYLARTQRPDGAWLPLWFGNQFAPDDENPTYGTARVLAAYRDCGRFDEIPAQGGLDWLRRTQNDDGGWGGADGIASSVEETALAAEIVISTDPGSETARCALRWLTDRVEDKTFRETTPIGFYFAKLWYFEELYPIVFTAAALREARRLYDREGQPGNATPALQNLSRQPVTG